MNNWKLEYLYYRYPDLKTRMNNQEIDRIMSETDFDCNEAKGFKAGWDFAIHVCRIAVQNALRE